MTTLSIGSSVTLTLQDGVTVRVATNGGFATVIVTPTVGSAQTVRLGPRTERMAFGPYSEGATVVIANDTVFALDYDVEGNLLTPSQAAATQAMLLGGGLLLPRYRAALAATAANTADTRIAYIGDSTVAGAYSTGVIWTNNRTFCPPVLLGNWLKTNLGLPVSQDSTFGTGSVAAYDYDPRVSYATWAGSNMGVPTILGSIYRDDTNAAAAVTVKFAEVIDTITVYYLTFSGGASFNVSVNGGAAIGAAVSTNAATGVAVSVKTCPAGVNSVTITKVASAGVFAVYGIVGSNSATRRVNVYNWSASGISIPGFADVSQPYSGGIVGPAIAPHLVLIQLGINDAIAASTAAAWVTTTVYAVNTYVTQGGVTYGCAIAHTAGTFATDLAAGNWMTVNAFAQRNYQALVDLYRPTSDIAFVTPTPVAAGSATLANQRGIVTACRQIAQQNGCPLIDSAAIFGTQTAGVAAGYFAPAADPIHPGPTGYQAIADAVTRLPGLLR